MRRVGIAALAFAMLSGSAAHAQSARTSLDTCLAASDEGQVLRDEGRYLEARAAFRTCATASCPAIVQANCARWLASVEEGLPTVVLTARRSDDAALAGDTTVEIDGAPGGRLSGTPLPIDPGKHVFKFQHDAAVVVVETLVSVGEKNRLIVARFEQPPSARVTPVRDPPPKSESRRPGGVPIPSLILGAVGLAGITVFGVVGSGALADLRALEAAPCATDGTCDSSEVRSVRTRFVVADLALGAGIAALGAGAVVWWLSRQTTVQVGAHPSSLVRFTREF